MVRVEENKNLINCSNACGNSVLVQRLVYFLASSNVNHCSGLKYSFVHCEVLFFMVSLEADIRLRYTLQPFVLLRMACLEPIMISLRWMNLVKENFPRPSSYAAASLVCSFISSIEQFKTSLINRSLESTSFTVLEADMIEKIHQQPRDGCKI